MATKDHTTAINNLIEAAPNPLVGPLRDDTLNNILGVLRFLSVATTSNPEMINDDSKLGLYLIYDCLSSAIDHEIEIREADHEQ